MIDQKRILTLNIRKYLKERGTTLKNFAKELGYENPNSFQNIMTGSTNPSWKLLTTLCDVTNIPLSEWFKPDAEIYGIEKEEKTDKNEFLSQLKAYQEETKEEPNDKVKVIFGEENYVEFNGRKLPTSEIDWNNLSAPYGDIIVTVDVLVDSIEKQHGTTNKR